MTETDHLKELVQVQITALSKQIDSLKGINDISAGSLEARMDRIDEKITRLESKAAGRGESWTFFVAAAGMVLAAISTFAFFMK